MIHVGERLHGFCGGHFGRDSYTCRTVIAEGEDWLVTRNDNGEVELLTGPRFAFASVFGNYGERKRDINDDWCCDA